MGENNSEESFDWLELKNEIGSIEIKKQSFWEKFVSKSKENPFVPIGATATLACLVLGLDSFRKGETRRSQMMMRGRVLAQGFTVTALALGIMYTAVKKNRAAADKPQS